MISLPDQRKFEFSICSRPEAGHRARGRFLLKKASGKHTPWSWKAISSSLSSLKHQAPSSNAVVQAHILKCCLHASLNTNFRSVPPELVASWCSAYSQVNDTEFLKWSRSDWGISYLKLLSISSPPMRRIPARDSQAEKNTFRLRRSQSQTTQVILPRSITGNSFFTRSIAIPCRASGNKWKDYGCPFQNDAFNRLVSPRILSQKYLLRSYVNQGWFLERIPGFRARSFPVFVWSICLMVWSSIRKCINIVK